MKDLFSAVNGNYNLRSQSDFRFPGINTVFYGANSIRYFGSVIRNSLPNDFKSICDFDLFNTLNANPTKWSNKLKQFVGILPSVFDQFVGLVLKGLKAHSQV